MDGAPLFSAFKQMQFISARNESSKQPGWTRRRPLPIIGVPFASLAVSTPAPALGFGDPRAPSLGLRTGGWPRSILPHNPTTWRYSPESVAPYCERSTITLPHVEAVFLGLLFRELHCSD
jgi:hypothetical protein